MFSKGRWLRAWAFGCQNQQIGYLGPKEARSMAPVGLNMAGKDFLPGCETVTPARYNPTEPNPQCQNRPKRRQTTVPNVCRWRSREWRMAGPTPIFFSSFAVAGAGVYSFFLPSVQTELLRAYFYQAMHTLVGVRSCSVCHPIFLLRSKSSLLILIGA